jgi:hypothetical protein
VIFSAAVERRLEELSDEAAARGDGTEFVVALAEFRRRPPLYPQFGDSQIDLKAQVGVIYHGIIRPLALRYGVLEERRMVFCASPPILLPMATPGAANCE